MMDIWYTFPAVIGDAQALVTFNQGYAGVADKDIRNNYLGLRVVFKNPDRHGLHADEELPVLSRLDEYLGREMSSLGAIYVGKITVYGCWFFYFYTDKPVGAFKALLEAVEFFYGYKVHSFCKKDPDKKYYWNELCVNPGVVDRCRVM